MSKSKAKTKEDFFKLAELKTVDVDVKGFGKVRIRQLSELERYRNLEEWLKDEKGNQIKGREEEVPYRLLILCAYQIQSDGQTGGRLFDDDDLDRLIHSSSSALLGLLSATIEINSGETVEKK